VSTIKAPSTDAVGDHKTAGSLSDAEILDIVMKSVIEKAVTNQPVRSISHASAVDPNARTASNSDSDAAANESKSSFEWSLDRAAMKTELLANSSAILTKLIEKRYRAVTTHFVLEAVGRAPNETGNAAADRLSSTVAEITHSVDFAIQSTMIEMLRDPVCATFMSDSLLFVLSWSCFSLLQTIQELVKTAALRQLLLRPEFSSVKAVSGPPSTAKPASSK
jgi:hypothetical protein